jgi:transcriptional regulator with XRE-family HTH domain
VANSVGLQRLFGEFLRARREEVRPESVGLPPVGRPRRVSGLRRSELAQLASISTDYYTRLEQGKLPPPSRTVLSAIARALRLDPDQEHYLVELAEQCGDQPKKRQAPRPVPRQILAMLDGLVGLPAIVVTRYLDILAWNPVAAAFMTDFASVPVTERNLVRLMYLNEEVRSRFSDWDAASRSITSLLRLAAARDSGDPRLAEIVNDLSQRDKDFRRWWASQSVAASSHGERRYTHPGAGEFELEWQTLNSSVDPDLIIVVVTAPDDAGTAVLRSIAQAAGLRQADM